MPPGAEHAASAPALSTSGADPTAEATPAAASAGGFRRTSDPERAGAWHASPSLEPAAGAADIASLELDDIEGGQPAGDHAGAPKHAQSAGAVTSSAGRASDEDEDEEDEDEGSTSDVDADAGKPADKPPKASSSYLPQSVVAVLQRAGLASAPKPKPSAEAAAKADDAPGAGSGSQGGGVAAAAAGAMRRAGEALSRRSGDAKAPSTALPASVAQTVPGAASPDSPQVAFVSADPLMSLHKAVVERGGMSLSFTAPKTKAAPARSGSLLSSVLGRSRTAAQPHAASSSSSQDAGASSSGAGAGSATGPTTLVPRTVPLSDEVLAGALASGVTPPLGTLSEAEASGRARSRLSLAQAVRVMRETPWSDVERLVDETHRESEGMRARVGLLEEQASSLKAVVARLRRERDDATRRAAEAEAEAGRLRATVARLRMQTGAEGGSAVAEAARAVSEAAGREAAPVRGRSLAELRKRLVELFETMADADDRSELHASAQTVENRDLSSSSAAAEVRRSSDDDEAADDSHEGSEPERAAGSDAEASASTAAESAGAVVRAASPGGSEGGVDEEAEGASHAAFRSDAVAVAGTGGATARDDGGSSDGSGSSAGDGSPAASGSQTEPAGGPPPRTGSPVGSPSRADSPVWLGSASLPRPPGAGHPSKRRSSRPMGDMLAAGPARTGRGLTMLCLDGGGIKGLVLVEVLKALERASGRRIHELFDVVCGTSTGGLLSTMVAGKRASLDDMPAVYERIRATMAGAQDMFSEIHRVTSGTVFDDGMTNRLLQGIVGDERLDELPSRPKIFLVAAACNSTPAQPYLFRNYELTRAAASASEFLGTSHCEAWRAVRATTSAPTWYTPAEIGRQRFVDGGILANNPTLIALTEAAALWPKATVSCVVSVGTGMPSSRPHTATTALDWASYIINDISLSSHVTHAVASSLLGEGQYFRLDPPMLDVSLSETRVDVLDKMVTDVRAWLGKEHQQKLLRRIARILTARRPWEGGPKPEGQAGSAAMSAPAAGTAAGASAKAEP